MSNLISVPTLLTTITPHSPNLFEVKVFQGYNTNGAPIESPEALLYCSDFELPVGELVFERHPYLKKHFIEKVTLANEVTISWAENENLDVWKYHQAWINCFYNRQSDQFVAGPAGKKRYAEIAFQKQEMVGGKVVFTDLYSIKLYGLTPQRNLTLRGSWNDSLNWPKYPLKYKVDTIAITELKPNGGTYYL